MRRNTTDHHLLVCYRFSFWKRQENFFTTYVNREFFTRQKRASNTICIILWICFLKVDRPEPALVVLVITSCLHILWVHFFVNQLEWLNFGLGLANAITWTTGCIVLNLYLYLKGASMGFDPNDFFFAIGSKQSHSHRKTLTQLVYCVSFFCVDHRVLCND